MARNDAKENRITQTLWLSAIIIPGIFLLAFLPEINFGLFQLKKIDILSDLRPDPIAEQIAVPDSLTSGFVPPKTSSSKNISITTIEDFSGENKILKHFYHALANADKQQVRVAIFGDSFIEGDIVSASLRDTLQRVFGGNGVGFVPLATEVSGFRKSIKHTYSGWETYSLLTHAPEAVFPIGISGYTYLPRENNHATYQPGKIPRQQNFNMVKIFYQNKGSASIHYRINDEPEIRHEAVSSDNIQQLIVTHSEIRSIQLSVSPHDSIAMFGVSFENSRGVYVDNFSMRRNSGIALGRLQPEVLKQFNGYLDYKLIILQYGLNVASESDSTNYTGYATRMIKIVKDLKVIFPKTSFLLLSVSDRSTTKEGKIVTMEAIPKMRNMQREIARKSGIAFWDMYEGMGGRNSIITYTESTPPLASKDYTHLTHLGGNKIGRKLADALLHEINKDE